MDKFCKMFLEFMFTKTISVIVAPKDASDGSSSV